MSEFLLDFEKPVVELEKKILSLKVSAEHSKIEQYPYCYKPSGSAPVVHLFHSVVSVSVQY